ncbi:hypothetical protein HMPREF2141_01023 [Bacteroides uniformis]|nr:hypothetical protein HMPREF2141_01023 [Bacteroides uniformis]
MHSVTHVADGADGEQYFQPGNPRQQAGKQRGVVRYYFTDRKHTAGKAGLRLLMTVGNYSSRLFIFINPGRAESQQQTIQPVQPFMGAFQTPVNTCQCFLCRD